MSRVIVKSLPKKLSDETLRQLFAEKGDVTDVQLKYNAQGKFRCFAFVGFKSEEQAIAAKEYFDNTYIQNCKIKVEICKNDNQQSNEEEKKEEIKKSVKEEFEDLKEDAEFLEFLKVQRNVGDTKKLWSDDVIMSAMAKKYLKAKDDKQEIDEDIDEKSKIKSKPDTIFKYTIAIRKIPQNQRKKKDIKEFFAPLKPISIRIPKIKCLAYVSFKTESELKQALDKHKSFMGKSQVHLQVLKVQDSKESHIEFNKIKGRIEKNVPVSNIEEYGRLFIRNLNYQCTVEDLEQLFKKYGLTTEINLPVDTLTQKIKGFAFVTFMFPEHAKQAFEELDRSTFQGRLLHIIPAELRENDFNARFDDDASSYKKRKASQLKGDSTKSGHTWNTLFLGQNAVANILSKKMNIDKSDFFKRNKKESLAARMALGETQLVNETRMFLESNGVFLNCFEHENIKRSKNTFLIKHLPANTTQTELNEFLSAYGRVKKIILPPSCITAIVEMENQQVAYDMFKKLAYKKFKNIPLYLEWAPVNVLNKDAVDVIEVTKVKKLKKLEYAVDEIDEPEEQLETLQEPAKEMEEPLQSPHEQDVHVKADEEREDKQKSYKILVRNVAFEAKEEDLKELFGAFGRLQSVRLPLKPPDASSSASTKPHRGFAFVEYVSRTDAKKAFDSMSQSTHFYGRRLVLDWAKPKSDDDL